jgi:hypothetical protein
MAERIHWLVDNFGVLPDPHSKPSAEQHGLYEMVARRSFTYSSGIGTIEFEVPLGPVTHLINYDERYM